MAFEMNCCWIALVLALVNLISLAVFFNYSIRINGRDKAILFTGNKDTLPVNLQAQTNYRQTAVDFNKQELEDKIGGLEKIIKDLQSKLNNSAAPVVKSFTSRSQQKQNKVPTPPTPPASPVNSEQETDRDKFNKQLKDELEKRRKKMEGEE